MSCTEGELTLERLDYGRVGDQMAVVRLLARLSTDIGAPRAAELLVTTGSDRGRYPARLCSTERRLLDHDPVRTHPADSELLWRATFGLPLALVESPEALFALFALTSAGGIAVTLPAPELVGSHPRRLALAEPRLRIQTSRLVAGQARNRMALLATTVVVTTTATPAVAFADGGSSGTAGSASAAATSSTPAALVVPATTTAARATVSTSGSGTAASTSDATASTASAATTPAAATPATTTTSTPASASTTTTGSPAPATTPGTPAATPGTPASAVPATTTAPAGAAPVAPAGSPAPTATAHSSSSAGSHAARPRPLHAPVRIGVAATTGHSASPAHLARPKVTHFFTAASHTAGRPHVHHHATVHPTCGRGAATGPLAIAAGGPRRAAVAAPHTPPSCTTSTGPGHHGSPVHHHASPVEHHGSPVHHHAAPVQHHSPTAASPTPHQGGSLTTGSQPGPVQTWPTGTGGDHGAPHHAAPHHHVAAHHHTTPRAAHHPAAPVHGSGGAPLTGPAPAPPVTPAPVIPAPSSGSSTSTTRHAGTGQAPAGVNPRSWTGSVSPNPSLTGPVSDLSGLAADANRPPSFLIPIYMEAGRRYDVPWTVLAAINSIESDYGRDLSTSSAGAVGWMQFEPSTWREYGLAVDGHGVPNPYDPRDAIFSAARYLAAAGAAKDITTSIFAYNHAGWYVDEVMSRARAIAGTAQYERRTLKHGVFSISFATGAKHHPTVSYRGGVLSHYDRLIAAANMVSAANFPYLWGGGHTQPARFGPFDCSGTVSYVMQQAGYAVPTSVSGDIPSWHLPAGPGQVTIFYNPTHTFMRIGDRFFGTSDSRPGGGAGWVPVSRLPADYLAGFNEVHVPRLGLNSFSPQPQGLQRLVSTRPRKIATASVSLGLLVFGAWKAGLTPF